MTGTVAPQLPEHWLTTHRNRGSAAPEYSDCVVKLSANNNRLPELPAPIIYPVYQRCKLFRIKRLHPVR